MRKKIYLLIIALICVCNSAFATGGTLFIPATERGIEPTPQIQPTKPISPLQLQQPQELPSHTPEERGFFEQHKLQKMPGEVKQLPREQAKPTAGPTRVNIPQFPTPPAKLVPKVQQQPQPSKQPQPQIPPPTQQGAKTKIPALPEIVRPTIETLKHNEEPYQTGTSTDVSIYHKITLPEAIDYAMSHSLEIRGTRLNVPISQNNIKYANRLKNPYLQTFFNMGSAATDNPDYVGMVFPIELFKRGPRKKLAQSTLQLTQGQVALAEFTLRLDVRQAYINLVAAKSVLQISEQQKQLLQELLNIAQRKYEVGVAPLMDVVQAKMAVNQSLIQLNSARTDVLVARYKFNALIHACNFDSQEDSLPQHEKFSALLTPGPSEKMMSFDCLTQIAMTKRLDIRNALQQVDMAKKNLTVTIRQRVPDIEVGGGFMFVPPQLSTNGNGNTGALIIGNVNNIPLLYQYTPEIKNAMLQVQQSELAYENVRRDALMSLHSAYDRFNTAQINLNYYNDVLIAESFQFLFLARRSYEVGKTNITNYIYIEQSYRNILLAYTNALADYYNAWVSLLREVNDEGLKSNG